MGNDLLWKVTKQLHSLQTQQLLCDIPNVIKETMVDFTPTHTLENWNLEQYHYGNLKYQVNSTLQYANYSGHFLCTRTLNQE